MSDIQLVQVYGRPLFNASRRPWATETAVLAAEAQTEPLTEASEPPPYLLVGVSAGDGVSRALLREIGNSDGPPSWVEEGAAVGDWTVGRIDPTRIALQRGGQEAVLDLFAIPEPAKQAKRKRGKKRNRRGASEPGPVGLGGGHAKPIEPDHTDDGGIDVDDGYPDEFDPDQADAEDNFAEPDGLDELPPLPTLDEISGR